MSRVAAIPRALLALDGGGALLAGAVVLAAHAWIARWYGVPPGLVLAIAAANLAYGSYSGRLAARAARGLPTTEAELLLLVAANAAWAGVCGSLVAVWAGRAGPLGLAHFALEGLYVGGLAAVEARYLPAPPRG